MLLKGKNAVIYGAGGSIGGTVARILAREGARVFVTGRSLDSVLEVANVITSDGGQAEAAQVDALDQGQIQQHVDHVVATAGSVDISFNAIWIRGDLQGTRLVDLAVDDFLTPITTAARTHFLTATAAARHMVKAGSGVIVTLSVSSSRLSTRDRRFHCTAGFGVACDAIESFTRTLAAEIGPAGVRVTGVRPDAFPETWGPGADEVRTYMEGGTALDRLPTITELGDTVAFLASDRASAIAGTMVNVNCGSVID